MAKASKEARAREKRLAQEERKKLNKASTPAPPQASTAASPHASTAASPHASTPSAVAEKKSIPWAIIISIVALVVSGATLWVQHGQKEINQQQAEINQSQFVLNQRAQDRASGKIRAKFVFVDSKNTDPARTKPFLKKQVGTGKEIFRIDTVDDLLRWAPFVVIQNVGEELIDSVKIDVDILWGHMYGSGVTQIEPKPLGYVETSTCELSSFGKLQLNQKAAFFIAPLLMDQMLHSRLLAPYPDADRESFFRIRVYCRLVGLQSYDEIQPSKSILLGFHWRQTGFDEEKCEYYIAQQPRVLIGGN